MGATYFILRFIDFPEKKESARLFNEKLSTGHRKREF